MTQRLLSIVTAVILSATALQVRADATVLAELDWSGLSWTTTGDVTVSLQTVSTSGPLSTLTSRDGFSWNFTEVASYVQTDQSATLINSTGAQSAALASSSAHYGLAGDAYRLSIIELNGSGTATLQLPYDFRLTQDGDFLARGFLAASILQTQQAFAHEAVISPSSQYNSGAPLQSGVITFTLDGNGTYASYFMVSSVMGQIQPAIPEPESWAMLAMGGAMLLALRRKKSLAHAASPPAMHS